MLARIEKEKIALMTSISVFTTPSNPVPWLRGSALRSSGKQLSGKRTYIEESILLLMKLHFSLDLHLINTEKEAFLFFFPAIRYVSPEKGQMFINHNREEGVRGVERGGHGGETFGLLLFSVCMAGSRNRNRNEVGRGVWFRYERVSLDWLL
ncbi:hypothetical protein CDAR_474651 [Caerostris darwini]|uniref:Uncharacterized protein n=1 Tax=Caerostris darwini TaxID=1538125 RepID=A0AAV4PP96_9ARAC|nr:hypothetical protein CDAR_474651 [Caerostris darwini]